MTAFLSTSITTIGQSLNGSESGLITSTGGIYVNGADAVTATTGTNWLTNDGYLYAYGGGFAAIDADSSVFEMINGVNGLISAENPTQGTIDMNLSTLGRIVNHGTIYSSNGNTIDFLDSDGDAIFQLINTGRITSQEDDAVTVDVGTGFMYISNSGEIAGRAPTLDLVSDIGSTTNHVIVNSGIITGLDSDAIRFAFGTGGGAQIVNSGTITAWDEAIVTTRDTDVRINNSGLIQTIGFNGNEVIEIAGGTDLIRNTGTIIGDVYLGGGDDLYQGNGGLVNGTVFGEEDNDNLRGGAFTDIFDGGSGDDELVGRGGDDDLFGGSGFDFLLGGAGNDYMEGGTEDDTLIGNSGDDTIYGDDGNDILRGQDGTDVLDGGANDDILDGGAGDDVLEGKAGADVLRGRSGEDQLAGGSERDLMFGGADADLFIFRSLVDAGNGVQRDVIADFEQGIDLINVAGLAAGVFDFLGTGGFNGTGSAELRLVETASGSTTIRMDADGNGSVDAEIRVVGVVGLTADDFAL